MTPGSPHFHPFAPVAFGPLSRCLRELAARLATVGEPAPGAFARVESTVDGVGIDLLEWLRGAPAGARRYFRDRSGRVEVAGVGVAASAELGAHLPDDRAQGGSGPRAVEPVARGLVAREPVADGFVADGPAACGGIRQEGGASPAVWFLAQPFDGARPREAAWAPFAASPCVLSTVEVRRLAAARDETASDGALVVALHRAHGTPLAAVEAEVEALTASLAAAGATCAIEPALVRETDAIDEAAWTLAVEASLERIRGGELRKIVLARPRRYAASSALDPVGVLARVASRETRGFRFLVEVGAGRAFLGVTPERLFSRHGRMVRSEAVAGTRPRGVDGVADRLLGESLLASAKDRREQTLVIERVREALSACATTLRIDAEPRLLRLAYVQHLSTRLVGELRPGVGDADLVRALHPTPAVAGAPVADAVAILRALEPFDRGLYAGPVGVVSADGAEVAVAIRSARIEGDALVAFAGAGIVDGSDPAEEWRETGHKLLAFERLAN